MTDNEHTNTNYAVVLVENLHAHKNAWKLARRIFRMITSVGVITSDIISIVVEDYKGKARIYLKNKVAQDFVIKVFSDIRDVMNVYDVRKVAACPQGLRFSRWKGESRGGLEGTCVQAQGEHQNTSGENRCSQTVAPHIEEPPVNVPNITPIPEEQSNDISTDSIPRQTKNPFRDHSNDTSSSTNLSWTMHPNFEQLADESSSSSSSSLSTRKQIENIMLDASTSVSGLPPEKQVISQEGECSTSPGVSTRQDKTVMVDVKTSTPQVSPCFCPETIFYHKNQFVGTETRHAEFKQGGVVFELRSFRALLGRYLCAFLNTEGGVIYFGVTDDGKAVGINVDSKFEDKLRLAIDTVVSAIKPTVPTSAYSVSFAKVMGDGGQIVEDLKVLEVCVHPRYSTKTPYSYDNNVYVRRDGSLRTM